MVSYKSTIRLTLETDDRALTLGPADTMDLAVEFRRLAITWFEETMSSSSLTEICSHPAYQRVIGFGPSVVPLVLEAVDSGQRHWGWALAALTGENPAADTDSPKAAAEAWLEWGRERGLINRHASRDLD